MKNVLIIEAYTNANIGSCALVENSIELIEKQWGVPRERIRVMAHNHDVFRVYGVETVPDFFQYPYLRSRISQVVWLLRTMLWMSLSWLFPKRALHSRRWEQFRWADVVVSVGAERINDKYIKNEFFSIYTYLMAKRLGKVMVLFPSTYGPFLYGVTKKVFGIVVRRVDKVFCRDAASFRLASSFGADPDIVILTPDVAIMQAYLKETGRQLLHKYTAARLDNAVIGVSVLRWTYKANRIDTPFSNYTSYVLEMAKLIDWVIVNMHVDVVLYPTNFPVNGCREDDVAVAQEIRATAVNKERVYIIKELPSPQEFKSMLSCSELNIVTRMHACILSVGANVPTLSVNYLFKLREFMASAGLSEYSIDIEEFCADKMAAMASVAWNERARLSAEIEQRVTCMQYELLDRVGSVKGHL